MLAKILVVEDDKSISDLITLHLKKNDFEYLVVHNGEDALSHLDNFMPDFIILDWMIPGLSGLEVLRRIRNKQEYKNLPILMLTAKNSEQDKIISFESGLDDYITKPFSQKLLLERVKTILRRSIGNKSNESNNKEVIKRGKLSLNMDRYECFWEETPIRLTVTEFLLLECLASRPGHVKSRDQLMSSAYDDNIYVDDRTIDSHIKRLRKKFKDIDKNFKSIETLYGVGYRYTE